MKMLSSKKFEEATKLWPILEITLQDLAWVEKNPKYKVDMFEWFNDRRFEGRPDKKCHVCLAGSTIARRLQSKVDLSGDENKRLLDPWFFGPNIARKLEAINHLREGG